MTLSNQNLLNSQLAVRHLKGGDNMPNRNGTGPAGQGPRTGRGAGNCTGQGGTGRFGGRGLGRGGRGRGFGRGLGICTRSGSFLVGKPGQSPAICPAKHHRTIGCAEKRVICCKGDPSRARTWLESFLIQFRTGRPCLFITSNYSASCLKQRILHETRNLHLR